MKPDLLKQQAHRAIQKRLGYEFRNMELLQQALTHRSYNAKHNERFEFVGDSILNYSVARMLFDAFPKLSEGELSRMRAALVNEGVLAEIALEMNVGDGVGDDAAVERCGQCLGKFVHGVDKEMIWHDFTRFAAFPHGCVQGRFDGTMWASAVRFEHDGF